MALKIATKLVDSFACAKIPARETCFRRKHLYLFVCVACAEFVCLIWLTTSKAPVKAFMDHFGAFEFKEKKYVVLLNCLLSYRSRKYFLVDQRKTSTKNTEIPWKGNTTKYFELIFTINLINMLRWQKTCTLLLFLLPVHKPGGPKWDIW